MGRRQVLPGWGDETGLTLLRLAILPSSWVLAVLEVAYPWGLNTLKKKIIFRPYGLIIYFSVWMSPHGYFPPTVPP